MSDHGDQLGRHRMLALVLLITIMPAGYGTAWIITWLAEVLR